MCPIDHHTVLAHTGPKKKNGLQVNPLPTLIRLSGYAENEWLKLKGDINK